MNTFQLIMLAMDALERSSRLAASLIHIAKQRGELDVHQEKEVRTRQADIMKGEHWTVEPDPAP